MIGERSQRCAFCLNSIKYCIGTSGVCEECLNTLRDYIISGTLLAGTTIQYPGRDFTFEASNLSEEEWEKLDKEVVDRVEKAREDTGVELVEGE